jgi:hypothetical protein
MSNATQLAYAAETARPCAICEEEIAAGSLMVRALGGSVHLHCKKRREKLLTTSDAADELETSITIFRGLAKRVGLEPEGFYLNAYRRECPLWSPEEVKILRTSPLLEALKRRYPASVRAAQVRKDAAKRAKAWLKKKARAQRRRERNISSRYPDWRQALPPAAKAMFNLNRFAKYRSCLNSFEIYALKNRFIQLLCNLGLCVEAHLHIVPDGLDYIAFRFMIDGRSFCWHQPKYLVTWPVELSSNGSSVWVPENREKPISLSTRLFEFAKALIMYVIEQGSNATTLPRQPETAPSVADLPPNERGSGSVWYAT